MARIKMVFTVDDCLDSEALWDMGQALASTGFCSRQYLPGPSSRQRSEVPTEAATDERPPARVGAVREVPDTIMEVAQPERGASSDRPSGFTREHTGLGGEPTACSIAMRRRTLQTHVSTYDVRKAFKEAGVRYRPIDVLRYLARMGFLCGEYYDEGYGEYYFTFTSTPWDDYRPRTHATCEDAIMDRYEPGRCFYTTDAALWCYHAGFDPTSATSTLTFLRRAGRVKGTDKRGVHRFPDTPTDGRAGRGRTE